MNDATKDLLALGERIAAGLDDLRSEVRGMRADLRAGASGQRSLPVEEPRTQRTDGAVFPNYGRSKGAPVAGASRQDLEYYAAGCRRTLGDPNKSRWHDKERVLLAAIEAELHGHGGGPAASEPSRGWDEPPPNAGPPPDFGGSGDEDIPF